MRFNFGIRAHDIAHMTTPELLAGAVRAAGFDNIQLVFRKAFADYSYLDAFVERTDQALSASGIHVPMLGAYFNPVHPDRAKVMSGIREFKENLRIAGRLKAGLVGTETGSYNGSPWTYLPRNHTEQAYCQTREVFSELVREAEKCHASVSIEPAWAHVIYSPELLFRLLNDLGSESVFVTIDLFNLLYAGNFEKRNMIFAEALRLFGRKVRIIHLKDGIVSGGVLRQAAPGQGGFDYPFMLRNIARFCPDAYLIFEGVGPDDIGASFSYVRSVADSLPDS